MEGRRRKIACLCMEERFPWGGGSGREGDWTGLNFHQGAAVMGRRSRGRFDSP